MENAKLYLNAIDTIWHLKNEYESELIRKVIDAKDSVNMYKLATPIKMHCPRGYDKDVEISILFYENCVLYYCTNMYEKFTKADFGAEDFVDMLFRIIKDNF